MFIHAYPGFPPSIQDITGEMICKNKIILIAYPEMPEGMLYPSFCLSEVPPFDDISFFVIQVDPLVFGCQENTVIPAFLIIKQVY